MKKLLGDAPSRIRLTLTHAKIQRWHSISFGNITVRSLVATVDLITCLSHTQESKPDFLFPNLPWGFF
jgi:hypothetical protein